MSDIALRVLEAFPEPETSELQRTVFADFEPSGRGVYSKLVRAVLAHAEAKGYASVTSRHVAANAAVIIAKLRLGFQISGFEYSEVYGPLVRLTYLVGDARRNLYRVRAAPLRPAE